MGEDLKELLDREQGKAWLDSGNNPILFLRRLTEVYRPALKKMFNRSEAICAKTDAIIYAPLVIGAADLAEYLNVPKYAGILSPSIRTKYFPNFLSPQNVALGAIYNQLTWTLVEQLFWQPIGGIVNEWRQNNLKLSPHPWLGPFGRRTKTQVNPILFGYSQHVVPKPSDWEDWHHVTGYWFLDTPVGWQPPKDLLDFLDSGEPPVYIGFGSMKRDPERMTETALAALSQTGQRGILLTGWGGLSNSDLPDNVFKIDSIPHDWLFPKCAAAVHHGGAGTTAAGLKAGIPTVTIPFFADQPAWGYCVHKLGTGTQPIPQKKVNAEKLAKAIQIATKDENLKNKAKIIGEKIRSDNGVGNAIEAFYQHLPKKLKQKVGL